MSWRPYAKKALSPAARRELVKRLTQEGVCSIRASCRMLKLARSTWRYRGKALHRRLAELSAKHPRYGFRRIAALLRQEGWEVGKRQVQRWRRDEGLRVPRDVSTGLPTQALYCGHEWTWDFIADATVRGWLARQGAQTLYITLGSPWENAYCESFNSRFRNEFLNREEFASELEARVLSAEWRRDYNEARPHSALGDQTPSEFAKRCRAAVGATPLPPHDSASTQPNPNLS